MFARNSRPNQAPFADRCPCGVGSGRRVKARAVAVELRVGVVADEGITDDVQLVTVRELGHVEAEAPCETVDAEHHQAEVLRGCASTR